LVAGTAKILRLFVNPCAGRKAYMKIIHLPKQISVRHYVDENPKAESSGNDFKNDMAAIEKNGHEILTATVMMEDRMIEAISKILFGTSNDEADKRQFFVDEVVGTSDFSFAFKRRVFTRLLETFSVLPTEEVKELKAGLNKIMEWRNAFAHGQVIHVYGGGFLLRYYSGGSKELALNTEYFEKVEKTIRDCLYKCNGIILSQ
jgi:hypothetical protein